MKRFEKFIDSTDLANDDLKRFQQMFKQLWVDSYTRIEFNAFTNRSQQASTACDNFFESFGVINGWYYTVDQYSRIKHIEHGLEDLK